MSVFFRRLIVLVLFITFVGTFYYFQFVQAGPEPETYSFRDDFKGIDRDFWYIGGIFFSPVMILCFLERDTTLNRKSH